ARPLHRAEAKKPGLALGIGRAGVAGPAGLVPARAPGRRSTRGKRTAPQAPGRVRAPAGRHGRRPGRI
ncbi:MAG: hypothetical protein AVDCRST_MAG56-5754, partial [uncultured Cytophagales bacterium]